MKRDTKNRIRNFPECSATADFSANNSTTADMEIPSVGNRRHREYILKAPEPIADSRSWPTVVGRAARHCSSAAAPPPPLGARQARHSAGISGQGGLLNREMKLAHGRGSAPPQPPMPSISYDELRVLELPTCAGALTPAGGGGAPVAIEPKHNPSCTWAEGELKLALKWTEPERELNRSPTGPELN